jgi:xanthine dehydrogenase YagR molybdenum-binding subunit
MKYETPVKTTPIDRKRVVGKPTPRIEGALKATGQAKYAYEWHDIAPRPVYGYVVGAPVAKGKLNSLDVSAAESAPGVLAVVTAANAGPLGKGDLNTAPLLGGPEIQHYHQAVALVVARSFEQARAAAQKIRADYTRTEGKHDLAAVKDSGKLPTRMFGGPPESRLGDFEGAFAASPVQLDVEYHTPDHAHAMMEPHATIAAWKGNKLTVWTANQMIYWAKRDLAKTLNLPEANVRVYSPYIGGGFGGKLFLRADVLLAALAARAVKRPVKVALQRPLMFNNTIHRPATIQRIRLGSGPDGKLSAYAHESWSGNLPGGGPEVGILASRNLYAAPNRWAVTKVSELDLPEGNAMRAPGDAPGSMAFECAIDEMAIKLKLDPVEFRLRNDTQMDPMKPDRPFSQRGLAACLRQGAQKFGWERRNAEPGKTREGRWLIGLGMAAAYRASPVMKSAARVILDKQGTITVETDMTDIGTGSYTIIAQTAAEMMGVPLERVVVKLGDSDFPVSAGSGGQFGAVSSTSGVYAACVKLRETIAQKAGLDPLAAVFEDGAVHAGGAKTPLAQLAANGSLMGEDAIEWGDLSTKNLLATFGAHFCEVAVDVATAEVRVRRMLAVCSAGRILNPVSARSQIIGAMTMGVGAALMEDLVVDKRAGFFVNHDLAGYEIPVHADIPHLEATFLDEEDPISSPLKARGVGELGICGAAAAVANAVYNATGVRVRRYPITLDKLLPQMPRVT